MTVPDLPGIIAPIEGAREIQLEVMRLLQRHTMNFPGAQPTSFSRNSIDELLNHDYFVAEKTDGLRCLLFLSRFRDEEGDEERCYLLTRKNEVSWVPNLHVPSVNGRFHVNTLIDGELVKSNDGKLRFFMFDLLACEGKLLLNRSLDKRLGHLDQLVFHPFAKFCQANIEIAAEFDFKIYMKTMSKSYRLNEVLTQKREHKSDGLIFTSLSHEYICGTDPYILKWKPANENSVDFAMRLDWQEPVNYESKPRVVLLAWWGKTDEYYADLEVSDELWENWKQLGEPLNYRIAECIREDGNWHFLRFRDDKEHGNNIEVVRKVVQSIEDNVSLEELTEMIPEIKGNWESREAKRRKLN